ncbi:PREDICTED: uncharacterized protein LOC105456454 [Wasmannia auropunctata]|uniref:uncharacterized protein LOC105456454 n=1 Tax=Wasmannia auropunctata TaxID=64793 RepID=UPI0005EE4439|nr:PREDICTED: uncharacterized protein LOC105456454 [Wasmannia auropunctata]
MCAHGFLTVFTIRRFIARRRRPSIIYSDNGTNFAGAANALNKLDWEKISKHSSITQIEWYFNPPSAPWWGGWWERLIGILKALLRKILSKASLPYETLNTILCDAEAIINSRPLTYISGDPDDLTPLSPSMFLQEIRTYGVPDCDMLYQSRLNKKFKHRQKVFNDLRKRFRTEYLGQLLLTNDKKETRKINIGDVVLIGDDSHRRVDWPLARVIDVITGRDGQARVFILKTKNGVFKRPIQRVYPLEIPQETDAAIELCERANSEKRKDKVESNPKLDDFKSNDTPLVCKSKGDDSEVVTTRSGRVVKKPDRLKY